MARLDPQRRPPLTVDERVRASRPLPALEGRAIQRLSLGTGKLHGDSSPPGEIEAHARRVMGWLLTQLPVQMLEEDLELHESLIFQM